MKMQWTDLASCQKELKVEVPAQEVHAEFEIVYGEFKRAVRVPGFRVGFAPRDLLERYHGDKAKEEVIRRLIAKSMNEALGSHKELDVVGRPQVTDVRLEPKASLSYSARMEVAPQVPVGRYKGLRLTRSKVRIAKEAVDHVLNQLAQSQAQLKPLGESRPAAEGDFLLVDLTEQRHGKPARERRDMVLRLERPTSPGSPEGIFTALLGMKPGEKRNCRLKDATVTVVLKEIKVRELPALDDSFAKSAGPFPTLQSLKDSIEADLKKQEEASGRRMLENQITRQLLEEWDFEVPPSLVVSQARRILNERAIELLNQGLPLPEVQEKAQILAEQAKVDALRQVRIFFILRRIAAHENCSAQEQEIEERLAALAARANVSVDRMRQDLRDRDLLDDIAWSIVRNKIMDLILKESDIQEKETA